MDLLNTFKNAAAGLVSKYNDFAKQTPLVPTTQTIQQFTNPITQHFGEQVSSGIQGIKNFTDFNRNPTIFTPQALSDYTQGVKGIGVPAAELAVAPKIPLPTYGINAGVGALFSAGSNIVNNFMSGTPLNIGKSLLEGAGQGVAITPRVTAVNAAFSPIVNKATETLTKGVTSNILARGIQGATNIPMDYLTSKSLGQNYSPTQAGIAFGVGALGAPKLGEKVQQVEPVQAHAQTAQNVVNEYINKTKTEPIAAQIPKVSEFFAGGPEIKTRKFAETILNSEKTVAPIKEAIAAQDNTYAVKNFANLKQEAENLIKTNIEEALKRARNPITDVDVQINNTLAAQAAAGGQFDLAKELNSTLIQAGTDRGRAVQAFVNYDKTTPNGALRWAQAKVNEYNANNPNAKLEIKDSQVQSLFDRAHNIQAMPEGMQRNIATNDLMTEINNLIPSSIVDKAITVWKAGLLTSLRTSMRNLTGNAIMQTAETLKDIPAAMTDIATSAITGKRGMTFNVKGTGEFASNATIEQVKNLVMKGYDPQEAITKLDTKHITWGSNPIEQTLKKYTDLVFRTLGAQDKPFWNASYMRSLYDQAKTEAINAGKGGDANAIIDMVQNASENMKLVATRDANVATFHDANKLTGLANEIKRWAGKNEATKLAIEVLAPFTGVPTSVSGAVFKYSPVGLLKGINNVRKVVTGAVPYNQDLQRLASQEVGRGVIGTGLFMAGAYLASKGLITGQPKDLEEARQWQLENKPANSILINDKWYNIGSVGPQTLVALAGAKLQEAKSVGEYALSLGKDQLSQTFLQGVQAPIQAINDPARYGNSYVGQLASSIVPNVVKDAAKSMDTVARETNTPLDYVKSGIPILRNTLTEKRDVLGQVVPQEPTGPNAFVDLFNSKTPVNNEVVSELSRLYKNDTSATPSKINATQTINGEKVKLTPEQLNTFEALAGQTLMQDAKQLISSPEYQNLSDEQKQKAFDSLVSKVRAETKKNNAQDILNTTPGQSVSSGAIPTNAQQPNTITIIDGEGKLKRIDTNTIDVKPPMFTGSLNLDKQIYAKYSADVTSSIRDVVALYEARKMTAEQANTVITTLQNKRDSVKIKQNTTRPKKYRFKIKKVKAPKLLKLKPTKIKAIKLKTR